MFNVRIILTLRMATTLRCVFGLRTIQSVAPRVLHFRQISSEDFREEPSKKKEKLHPETPLFPNEYAEVPPKGKIYDKKPFRIELEAKRNYHWCVCGTSKQQPFCDGSHKQLWGTGQMKTGYKWRPHRFQVDSQKECWMCNCKQTSNPPFCDGSHKQPHVQAAIR